MADELLEIRRQAEEALERIWFIGALENIERTDITLSIRLHIRPGLFVQVFLGTKSGSLYLALIEGERRLFGIDRETIRLALEAENIEARPVWKPMHLQPIFSGCQVVGGAVAEDLFEHGLCLPSGSNLAESVLPRVVEAIRGCQRGMREPYKSNLVPCARPCAGRLLLGPGDCPPCG